MSDLLFVYGTLLSKASGGLGAVERKRLLAEAVPIGPACVHGLLYDLGHYPGLVDSTPSGPVVHGEIIRLVDPTATLVWLDTYEGVLPPPDVGEYVRVVRRAALSDGRAVEAWCYIYQAGTDGAKPIVGGRWLTPN